MKKTIPLLLSALLLSCGISLTARAEVKLAFDSITYSVAQGGAVQVGIRIDGLGDQAAPSLSTFDLAISYDPSIITPTAALFGDPVLGNQLDLEGFGSVDSATISPPDPVGLFSLSFDSPGILDSQQRGSFILATVTFSALSGGTSPLGISINALGDSEGNALPATVAGATVSVSAIPEPEVLVVLIAGLLLLIGRLNPSWKAAS